MGNLTIGIKEHIIFPETTDEDLKDVFGLGVTVVTTAKTTAKAKRTESKPVSSPVVVAKAVAPAAWLEGMPPVPINHLKLNLFSRITPRTTLTPWAMAHTMAVMTNTLLLKTECISIA